MSAPRAAVGSFTRWSGGSAAVGRRPAPSMQRSLPTCTHTHSQQLPRRQDRHRSTVLSREIYPFLLFFFFFSFLPSTPVVLLWSPRLPPADLQRAERRRGMETNCAVFKRYNSSRGGLEHQHQSKYQTVLGQVQVQVQRDLNPPHMTAQMDVDRPPPPSLFLSPSPSHQ